MSDMKDDDGQIEITAEQIAALNEVMDRKIRTLKEGLVSAIDRYHELVNKSQLVDPNAPINHQVELELLESVTYLGLLLNGLSTLTRQEATVHASFLKDEGIPQSLLIARAAAARVNALKFIETMVQSLGADALKVMGISSLDALKDAATGKPVSQSTAMANVPNKGRSDLN